MSGARILILMGVTGSGKSTIGHELARELGCKFYDGDDFHPIENKTKMSAGVPLTDRDRTPWLLAIREQIQSCLEANNGAIFACSALKEEYRHILSSNLKGVKFIHLNGSYECIQDRLSDRKGHFMNPELLKSQFETLELPEDAILVDISLSPQSIVASILKELNTAR